VIPILIGRKPFLVDPKQRNPPKRVPKVKGLDMFCIYDNPRTWARELWRDGELAMSITLMALEQARRIGHCPSLDFAIFTARPWKEGHVVGDPKVMEKA
jgi:hypothetical protein